MSENISELDKARLDIAWKWFEYHAKQRTTLFYFFLFITGIILNAYVFALRENLMILTFAIGLLGVVQSIFFILFDKRNRQLATHAENVIEKVERTTLFPDSYYDPDINKA